MTFRLERHYGDGIQAVRDDIARLRVALLSEYPCLYHGTLESEQQHLKQYLTSPRSVAVVIRHNGKVVGAAAALPLADAEDAVQRPFRERERDAQSIFFLSEALLLDPYRGRGLGVRLFHEREAYARSVRGVHFTTFYTVERSEHHPRKPRSYQPRDAFWRARGYERLPALTTLLTWRDVHEPSEQPKPVIFWMKDLRNE